MNDTAVTQEKDKPKDSTASYFDDVIKKSQLSMPGSRALGLTLTTCMNFLI